VENAEDFEVRMRGYPAKSSFSLGLFREGERTVNVTPAEFPPQMVESLVWDRLGLKVRAERNGLVITGVRRGSAASEIGLAPGDYILRLNNQPIRSQDQFRELILAARASHNVMLLVRRGNSGYHVPLPF
jgi:serine protease Do